MKLTRLTADDAEAIRAMQQESFFPLYQKYRDAETSPACESTERIAARLRQSFTYYYRIDVNGETVGAVRVVDRKTEDAPKRISPLFILPRFQNRGYAQQAIRAVERLHGAYGWELDTILQEKGNCYLYEKMGYRKTGRVEIINERMSLVFYRKD